MTSQILTAVMKSRWKPQKHIENQSLDLRYSIFSLKIICYPYLDVIDLHALQGSRLSLFRIFLTLKQVLSMSVISLFLKDTKGLIRVVMFMLC